MKLLSWNINGLRAVHGKGFADWMKAQRAEAVCLQEIKVHPDQLDEAVRHPKGYHAFWHPAEKRGYSGVAIFTKREPLSVRVGLGHADIDREGRVLIAEFPEYLLVSAYFPNSQRDHARLDYKLDFCGRMLRWMNTQRRAGKNVVLCGDYNIAHREIDLRNPRENKNNAGFLPAERAWMDKLVAAGYIDTFRHFEPGPGHYTWWSYRPTVRERNIGWRLDYFFVNEELRDRLKRAWIQCDVLGSDHCPVALEVKS